MSRIMMRHNIIPKITIVDEKRPIYSMEVIDEPNITTQISTQDDSFLRLTEFRNNNRIIDSNVNNLYYSYYHQYTNIYSNILEYYQLYIETRLVNKDFLNKPNFVRNALNGVEISTAQYLTLKEITLLIFYLKLVLDKIFIEVGRSYYVNIHEKYSYDSLVKLYELFFYDIYYTFDIDFSIYNSLMEEMDKELYRNKISSLTEDIKKQKIREIYITNLIDCLLLTPLNRMGNYDNSDIFFRIYLAFLTIIINGNYSRYKKTRFFFSVKDKLLPEEWLIKNTSLSIKSRLIGGNKTKTKK